MSYQNQLHPWLVVCTTPEQSAALGRFRSWNEAENHIRMLQRRLPTATYTITFAPIKEEACKDEVCL
ncbi:MAG: hypothetical protein HC881_22910 [Leptolyngbyaceae cyanobacterium SL_7_1]|nr:hypothetical protein [Leptolyngbyaceae cyanobacterium SL_7_1]